MCVMDVTILLRAAVPFCCSHPLRAVMACVRLARVCASTMRTTGIDTTIRHAPWMT